MLKYGRFARLIGPLLGPLAAALVAPAPARGDVFTPVASYEPAETDLTVTANPGDVGLSVTRVPGGANGAPAATDGGYLLRVQIANEADRKVEFRHNWTTTTYDLAGNVELLADVYVASSGAIPGLIGIWSPNWQPPDAWQPATNIPTSTGAWRTVSFNVASRSQVNLDYIYAFVLENLAGPSGTLYVDNLRLRSPSGPQAPDGVAAVAYAGHNDVHWAPLNVVGLEGYHVYRAAAASGPFTRLTPAPVGGVVFRDEVGPGSPRLYYQVTSVVSGEESSATGTVSALYNGLSEDELLDLAQEQTFQYFWAGGHPNSGMAREGIGLGHPSDTVTIGGTGFGLMALVVGAERGFVTRFAAADRVRRIVRFLDGVNPDNPALPSGVQRYHGAWAHHYNGVTGATIPFAGAADNGGDLVETAFLVQGLLTVRQYFDDAASPVETEIRNRATSMWAGVEWDWYRRFPGGNVLYWHWSPTHEWQMNLPIRGFNETQIVYLLAVASPTHAMPASCYALGYAGLPGYANGNFYYGYQQWVGQPLGGPLFFTHYSHLGFDPRFKRDAFANYFDNSRNISLINRAHCIDNPGGFAGYGPLAWGLTASNGPTGYAAFSPTNDNGTIAPTAALSAMPYVPAESRATLRYFYDNYPALRGTYGFKDAFNPSAGWTAGGWLAIDQGPIVVMIENYRSGLLWKLFMRNPEINPMLAAIGLYYDVDFDTDGDIDGDDLPVFTTALAGPQIATPPPGVTAAEFALADLDGDGDVDLHDAALLQTLFTGP